MRFRQYMEGLHKSRRAVQRPGSRGGHYWLDRRGQVHYGTRPQERVAGGQYRADPVPPPTDDRTRLREAIWSAKPLGPELRQEQRRMEAYGYHVQESIGIANEPLAVRKATFKELLSAIELLHQAFPGLTALVRSAGLRIIVNSRIEHMENASGYFQSGHKALHPLIVIDGDTQYSPGHTFFHEFGHFVDNALAQRGEFAKVGTTRGASELPGHPVRTLVGTLKRTTEHKAFVREVESYEPGSRSYNIKHGEVFARFFNALAQQEFSRRGTDQASPLARPDFHEMYTPEQLDSFGTELRHILRLYGLEKSLRHVTG